MCGPPVHVYIDEAFDDLFREAQANGEDENVIEVDYVEIKGDVKLIESDDK